MPLWGFTSLSPTALSSCRPTTWAPFILPLGLEHLHDSRSNTRALSPEATAGTCSSSLPFLCIPLTTVFITTEWLSVFLQWSTTIRMVPFGGPGIHFLCWLKELKRQERQQSVKCCHKWKRIHSTAHRDSPAVWQPHFPRRLRFLYFGGMKKTPSSLWIGWLSLLLGDWAMWTKTGMSFGSSQRSLAGDAKVMMNSFYLEGWGWGRRRKIGLMVHFFF